MEKIRALNGSLVGKLDVWKKEKDCLFDSLKGERLLVFV